MDHPGCVDSACDDLRGPENACAAAGENDIVLEELKIGLEELSLCDSSSSVAHECGASNATFAPSWVCAICLEKINMEDSAQVKGCEHVYCVNCILRWASYKENPWCPQCKLPFYSLYVCKGLDGRPSDYMQEESVCLLLRAAWFEPVQEAEEAMMDDYYQEEQEYDEEYYYTSNVRLGNRRWGDSGYVRAGRREARPIGVRQVPADEASGSEGPSAKPKTGRRAKRAQKREAAISRGNVRM